MSFTSPLPSPFLSAAEWKEMDDLRKAISDNPAAVVSSQQERFTALFARSLAGKGDRPVQ